MLLSNWKGISPKGTMSRYVDDFFNDRYKRLINYNGIEDDEITLPAINVEEEENAYQLSFAAPGYHKEDFNVEVDNGVLIISAHRSIENNGDENGYTRREFNYQSFSKRFTLPEHVKDDQIQAKYENGILKISIPCQPQTEKNKAIRQISVA